MVSNSSDQSISPRQIGSSHWNHQQLDVNMGVLSGPDVQKGVDQRVSEKNAEGEQHGTTLQTNECEWH